MKDREMLNLDSELSQAVFNQFFILNKLGLRRQIALLTILARQFDLSLDEINAIIEHNLDKEQEKFNK